MHVCVCIYIDAYVHTHTHQELHESAVGSRALVPIRGLSLASSLDDGAGLGEGHHTAAQAQVVQPESGKRRIVGEGMISQGERRERARGERVCAQEIQGERGIARVNGTRDVLV
jgi:hypothetical protein